MLNIAKLLKEESFHTTQQWFGNLLLLLHKIEQFIKPKQYETQITVNKNGLDEAIRVLIVSQIDGKREDTMYMLPDTEEVIYTEMPEATHFINERLIMKERIDYFFHHSNNDNLCKRQYILLNLHHIFA